MRIYPFDLAQIESSADSLAERIASIVVAVNASHRARRISVDDAAISTVLAFVDKPTKGWSGYQWHAGAPVVSSTQVHVETSVLGVAWYVGRDKRTRVRVCGGRIRAPWSSRGPQKAPWFGLSLHQSTMTHALTLVYPVLWVPYRERRPRNMGEVLQKHLKDYPLAVDEWGVLGDWREDQGDELGAANARLGRTQAELLVASGV